jgi:hypothetical protein
VLIPGVSFTHRAPTGAQLRGVTVAKAKKEVAAKEETLLAYKGFNPDWTCRDFQFELGKTYTEKKADLCHSGFHACENPLDIFSYYEPTGQMAIVELGGVSDKTDSDSKRCGKSITIKAALTIPLLVSAAIEFIASKCDPAKAEHATGDRSASSATGYSSASSATGDRSASSATGYSSASSATGYRSASSATGDRSASSATGDSSASSATGDRSASSATGYRSASSATGDRSASSVKGKNAVAMNIGIFGRAMADEFGAIVLCNHDDDYNIRHIRASKVGENGVKAGVWYVLDDAGEFQEAA